MKNFWQKLKRPIFVLVSLLAVLSFGGLWFFVFKPYQKERVKTFLHPLTNVLGSGYNVYQSTIAIGSGQLLGKGVGLGTPLRRTMKHTAPAFSSRWWQQCPRRAYYLSGRTECP
jgi:cell division protein FtsW (lipid II flippase)